MCAVYYADVVDYFMNSFEVGAVSQSTFTERTKRPANGGGFPRILVKSRLAPRRGEGLNILAVWAS